MPQKNGRILVTEMRAFSPRLIGVLELVDGLLGRSRGLGKSCGGGTWRFLRGDGHREDSVGVDALRKQTMRAEVDFPGDWLWMLVLCWGMVESLSDELVAGFEGLSSSLLSRAY